MYDAEKQDSGGVSFFSPAEEEIKDGDERSSEERLFSAAGSGVSVLCTASKRSLRLDLNYL